MSIVILNLYFIFNVITYTEYVPWHLQYCENMNGMYDAIENQFSNEVF